MGMDIVIGQREKGDFASNLTAMAIGLGQMEQISLVGIVTLMEI
jgi:hypothetical protein